MKTSPVQTLGSSAATLETVGGKGLSLAKMILAGLPVPDGFHITTEAYWQFVERNDLQPRILAALEGVDAQLPEIAESASAAIRGYFMGGSIPPDLAAAISEAYAALVNTAGKKDAPVAVRSSATAEDLPDASFAGQQETFLNVRGGCALLEAVQKCWASLWTARAIVYRARNHIDPGGVALAVVVQEMVNAESAGVLFTVNPITGRRDEMVINAAWGLGEAVVGGLVSPDTIVLEKSTGRMKTIDVQEKTVITVATENGTEELPLMDARRRSQVLKEGQISALAEIARSIEAFYGQPQDIEWCCAEDRFYIVQSRPITALPEAEAAAPVEWKLPKGAYAAMRNNIVELMVSPLSPLFGTLGVQAINRRLSRLMEESFGMRGIMPPQLIIVVNHYAYNNGSVSARGMARIIFGAGKIMKMMFTGAVERWTENGRPQYYKTVNDWQAKNWHSLSSVGLLEGVKALTEAAVDAYGALVSGVIPAAWMTEALFTAVYKRLIRRRDDPPAPTFLLGFDSFPIRADKSLYSLAEWARQEPELAGWLESTPAERLSAFYENGPAPRDVDRAVWQEWRDRFEQHLREYGHTIYDLDFLHPVPADDPAPVLDALKLYLRGQGSNPYTRQQASIERREQAADGARQRLKGLRLKWFNRTLTPAQKYAPLREDGLAEVGLAYPLIRQMLRELGRRFAAQAVIQAAEDIYWLTEEEVVQTAAQLDAGHPVDSLCDAAARRKEENLTAMRVVPPLALPQMKIFGFDLMSLKGKRRGKGNTIKGVGASPGRVTGTARVLQGPADFSRMQSGEVLVAPITTPAWTPLFAMASAVVTDIGGPLSHGSIVAREYGIPAVLGTGNATRRIQDGQRITVDGSAGTVTVSTLP